MMLNYFAKGLFRNIYDKLGHKYVWNLPERFTNSVDIDSLLNDLIDMIRDTTNNIEKDFKGVIERGTPLVQVIPFKREKYEMESIDPVTSARVIGKQRMSVRSRFKNFYRDLLRQKKEYK